jgi:Flp pilus assembly protein TadD
MVKASNETVLDQMTDRRTPWRLTAVATLSALLLTGCASDPMTDRIRADRDARAGERHSAPRAEAVVRVADATVRAGDLATAASLYRRAHATDPSSFDAAAGLGRTLARLGAPEEAAAAWRAAVRLRPEDADALRGLGNALIAMGLPAQAVPPLRRALEFAEDVRLYSALGVAHDMLADHRAAQAFYRIGLEVAPADPALSNNLALSLAISGDHAEAIRLMRAAAALPGAELRHRMNLALVLGLAGESEAAAEIVRAHTDDAGVRKNVAYYEQLRAMGDRSAIAEALGVHYAAR